MKGSYILIANIFKNIKVSEKYIIIKALCLVKNIKGKKNINFDKIKLQIGDFNESKIEFKSKKGFSIFKGFILNRYTIKIDIEKIKKHSFELEDNRLDILYKDNAKGKIRYSLFKPSSSNRITKMIKGKENKVIYIRRTRHNNLYLTYKEKPNPEPVITNIAKRIKKMNNKIIISGFGILELINSKKKIDFNELKLDIEGEDSTYQTDIKFKWKKGLPYFGKRLNFYKIELDLDSVNRFDIQNRLILNYKDEYFGRIIYTKFKGKYKTSKVINDNNTSIYLRQTIGNTMYLTVRESNIYDFKKGKNMLRKAKLLSCFTKAKDIVLMYEKECERYEESASVLYEKIIDLGYKNVYYILDKNSPKYNAIKEKYKKNIIDKGSLKHLIYFFKCKNFVGTETLGHAIQLRASNKVISKKIKDKKNRYVFLQHGVMYMVSLDAEMRSGFRSNNFDLYRVVVSSKLEKDHFIELGGLKEKELYVTGLAKFDNCMRYDNADKIVIMPTWRRWETNEASIDFTKTKYYKMLERMVDSIPGEYHNKLIVLPHPLMKKVISETEDKLSKYMVSDDTSYDDVLKTCDLLITDYSSIAYDAFYRGAKVIFYWEEKEECMKHYGGNAHLMINEDNIYGDICYNKNDLKRVFAKNYMKKQKSDYIKKYKQIVEFDDGKNSERIIECLKKDKILK